MNATPPTLAQVQQVLRDVHGEPVRDLEPLDGGFWSSAFSYRFRDRELVLRLGQVREGFEMDRAAMAFARPGLPVPDVLDIGQVLDGSYAISVRHHGRFLESIRPEEAPAAAPAIAEMLGALRAVPAEPGAAANWYPVDGSTEGSTWRQWLTDGLTDDPRQAHTGWRSTLAADARLDRLFRACERRIGELVDACPERRDLVHGDLLYSNVLVAEDLSHVTGVFSWKCSVRGDFLFDVACCTFWGPWHPGIAAVDVWAMTIDSTSLSAEELGEAKWRHHCYELQIGAHHLGWSAWVGDQDVLESVAARTEEVLERGPL